MVPQELEADIPTSVSNRTSEAGSERLGTEMTGARGGLSPVREHKPKTPMAEMDAEERGLGEPMPLPRDIGRGEQDVNPDDIVSPSSDTMPSIMGRTRPGNRTSGDTDSPTISEWSPNSPVQRRGSRFEERL